MKNKLPIAMLLSVLIFSACKKEDTNNGNLLIHYDFTATMAGNYNFETNTGPVVFSETVNTVSWSKSVNVTDDINKTDSAVFTVHPPADWLGTANEANVTLKIFVNNIEKASESGLLTGADRSPGIQVSIAY